MKYSLSKKYNTATFNQMIMGPHPLKLTEELMLNCKITKGSLVCDLGSGTGLSSMFLAKEYGFKVVATDLWSNPKDNQKFFKSQNLLESQIKAVKADANDLNFEKELFDAVVSVDSYNYFGRDKHFLDNKLLPYLKSGGYVYICVPGMIKDCHCDLPKELLLSWTEEQLDYIHDIDYWTDIIKSSKDCFVEEITSMQSLNEPWFDWIAQDNEYAINDRKSINAGALKYFNFIKIVLKKR